MSTQSAPEPPLEQHLEGLQRRHRGKVRDIFAVDEQSLLLVATDRVSAFDVVLPQRLEGKGKILTSLSEFWFARTSELIQNHVLETDVRKMPAPIARHAALLEGRSMLVRKATPLKAEFIVRGYLAGSGFKEYVETGALCGHELPVGLLESDELPEPILTPSTKAPAGEHDANITLAQLEEILGPEIATQAGALSLELFEHASEHCAARGILLADTKFEFGLVDDQLVLIDEVFTPDSSRYWSATDYAPGRRQDSFDKQIIRDALLDTGWDKTPPAPALGAEIMERAMARYLEIHQRITGAEA